MDPIEKVIFFTLSRRRPERFWSQLGALKSRYVPDEVIYPMNAMDGANYETSRDVIYAAVRDGFPHFGKLTDDWLSQGYTPGERGSLATTWSFLRAFREVIAFGKPAIVMVDNFFLWEMWWDLNEILEPIKDLKLMQLHHWDSRIDAPEKSEDYCRVPWYPNEIYPRICEGLAGAGDSVLLLSPEGAEALIQWCAATPYDLVETVLYRKAHQENMPGCYSTFEGGSYYKAGNFLQSPYRRLASGVLHLGRWTGKTDSERTAIR